MEELTKNNYGNDGKVRSRGVHGKLCIVKVIRCRISEGHETLRVN